jgi:hypothetical protein
MKLGAFQQNDLLCPCNSSLRYWRRGPLGGGLDLLRSRDQLDALGLESSLVRSSVGGFGRFHIQLNCEDGMLQGFFFRSRSGYLRLSCLSLVSSALSYPSHSHRLGGDTRA